MIQTVKASTNRLTSSLSVSGSESLVFFDLLLFLSSFMEQNYNQIYWIKQQEQRKKTRSKMKEKVYLPYG